MSAPVAAAALVVALAAGAATALVWNDDSGGLRRLSVAEAEERLRDAWRRPGERAPVVSCEPLGMREYACTVSPQSPREPGVAQRYWYDVTTPAYEVVP